MIKIKVDYNDNYVKSFKVKGHALYDEYGKDIVCASVSSIVILSCNLALRFDEKSISVIQKDGLIDVTVNIFDDVVNTVFLNMIDSLKELEKQYKNNVKFV